YVLIIGENELEQGQAVLRNMATQEQQEIAISSLLIDALIDRVQPQNKPEIVKNGDKFIHKDTELKSEKL
ncbi:MAG: His/Gly/Thr/Pro-type tRNA ligase C-terminal domain-containing protein, partial [Thermodesulfobacteriota bacterium]